MDVIRSSIDYPKTPISLFAQFTNATSRSLSLNRCHQIREETAELSLSWHHDKLKHIGHLGLQLFVLFLRCNENFQIRIGVFPKSEKVLIGLASGNGVSSEH